MNNEPKPLSITERQIAMTILSQIGVQNCMCLGMPSKWVLPESSEIRGGLGFKFTNCFKIRNGTVLVKLMADDTYTVVISNQLGNEKATQSNLYCEDLAGYLMEKIGY